VEAYNLVSLAGLFLVMALGWSVSRDRRVVNWRLIAWGVACQWVFAAFVFWTPAGADVFLGLNEVVVRVLDASAEGTRFVFGRLALPPGTTGPGGEPSLGFILAFQALPGVVFFSALVAILYYYRVLPLVIRGFSSFFTRTMRVSGAESLCASSNIFVGVEAALTVRPHLEEMTESELCTVLTCGMSTIASTVLALYVFILREQFPTIAGHLLSASVLSAPAGLVMSKLVCPELDRPKTLGATVRPHYEREGNPLEAVINGANSGLQLAFGIVALLLAFIGSVALVDLVLGSLGTRFNPLLGLSGEWSLGGMLAYLFDPLTLALGVPLSDAMEVSRIIGIRTVATEVQSYQDLAALMASGGLEHGRSVVIAAYALCGFAHVASLAIFVGGIAALVPQRIGDLSRVSLRALLAATLACLMTAAVAGAFYTSNSLLLS